MKQSASTFTDFTPRPPMNVWISEYPDRLKLSTFPSASPYRPVEHANAHDVFLYLHARVRKPETMRALRMMLRGGHAGGIGLDDDVLRDAASRIMLGRLFLSVLEAPAGASAGTAGAAEPEGILAPPPKRPAMSPPPPLPPPRKPAPTEAPAVEPEETAFLAQDVQAAALEQAAVDGTPFCEVCAKAAAAAGQPA